MFLNRCPSASHKVNTDGRTDILKFHNKWRFLIFKPLVWQIKVFERPFFVVQTLAEVPTIISDQKSWRSNIFSMFSDHSKVFTRILDSGRRHILSCESMIEKSGYGFSFIWTLWNFKTSKIEFSMQNHLVYCFCQPSTTLKGTLNFFRSKTFCV